MCVGLLLASPIAQQLTTKCPTLLGTCEPCGSDLHSGNIL